ncbi:MAG: hypothetical protein AAB325_09970 [Pseudomonadota bacterium]
MLDPQQANSALRRLFQKHPVAELSTLFQTLQTSCRMSVFHRLKAFGYFSSYTHAGRYYTLHDIPQFDSYGLWRFGDIGFSHLRTLKASVAELVRNFPEGRTHRELELLFGVPVFNTLRDLLRAKAIRREPLNAKASVYLDADLAHGAKQLRRRLEGSKQSPPTASARIIEILLELLRSAQVELSPPEVAQRLAARDIAVSVDEVREVLTRYGLGEKKGVRSPRLRR